MPSPSLLPNYELAAVFGAGAADVQSEVLVHNPKNAVTEGVWRVRAGDARAVLKVIRHGTGGATEWSASNDPRHWNYWRREAHVHESPLRDVLAGSGFGLPRLLGAFERDPRAVALWFEDVDGRRGEDWDLEDHRAAARALGHFHVRASRDTGLAGVAWTSRSFLRAYAASKPVDPGLVDDDAVWSEGVVAEALGPEVREAGRHLLAAAPETLALMERLPRTLSHLDFWPLNLIRRADGEVVAVDWGFFGDGALGEDLGNHVPDSAFDLFVAPADLPELDRVTFAAYLAGLRDEGFDGDERLVRLGVCASAIKYVWLLPLLLERAQRGAHAAYGGGPVADLVDQYRRRGETLRFLSGWLDEAAALARATGFSQPG